MPETFTALPIPFAAYKGLQPYIFVSYAHKDSAQVYPLITRFHEQNYNIWYDEGIEPGIEWPEEIANALNGSRLFVVFISPNSVASENVRNEINFALAKKMPFIAIHLCQTDLTPGLQLQIGSKQAILFYQMDADSFERKYRYSFDTVLHPGEKPPEKPAPPPTVRPAPEHKAPEQKPAAQPATPAKSAPPPAAAITFACDIIRQAACAEIGFTPDKALQPIHCAAVKSLRLYADAYGSQCLADVKRADSLMVYRKSDTPLFLYEPGSLTTLNDLAYFQNLSELKVPFQQFSDLAPLAGLPLVVLDISLNKLGSLAPLAALKQLKVLYLEYAEYDSLLALDGLETLNFLSFSAISPAAFSDLCSLRLPNLLHLCIKDSKLESLAGISNLKSVNWLEVNNCTIFSYEDIAELKSIDTLSLNGSRCFDYSFLNALPNLKTLSVNEEQKKAISEQFGALPPYLKA